MVNCEKCGAELREGAAYCSKCGAPVTPRQAAAAPAPTPAPVPAPAPAAAPVAEPTKVIDLAGWGERIIAFIIDAIIFGLIFGIIGTIIALPSITWYNGVPNVQYIPFFNTGLREVFFFLYFIWMDMAYGQSIGKMIMKIRVTNLDGGPITIGQAAVESFGKAFGALLFFDVILGWIFTQPKSQRIFTYLARTIVVKDRA